MYYLGLNIEPTAVGWAVMNENYELLRKKGKDLWGVRLFDKASTAEERRTFRTSRRRRAREIARIGLLKEYFADAIEKIDSGFYVRLDESKYHENDKHSDGRYSIFADKNFTDKEYFKKYPTIFHLRKELLESKEQHDVRLVYLAILNLFKHRGNFLNETLNNEDNTNNMQHLFSRFCEISDNMEMSIFSSIIDIKDFERILSSKTDSKSEKADKLSVLLGITKKDKAAYEFTKMFCGLSGKLSNIWNKEDLGDDYSKKTLSFIDSNYEEHISNLANILSTESLELLECAKQIHDKGLLNFILKGHTYLSEARVEAYEKHKEDLAKLKMVIKKYCEKDYDTYFRTMAENNYSGYAGSVNSEIEKTRRNKDAKNENYKAFWTETKRLLSMMPETDEIVNYLQNELEKESLLPKQLTFQNSVIPNQLHLLELKKILSNAECYLHFLTEKDEKGLTISEKIIQLFNFRIPYYVGPLFINDGEEGTKWIVRKEKGKVLPWNIEEKVDMEETRKAFIQKMVRSCTYIYNEKTLPKNSLLYEKFMVLNELNNVRVFGEKLSVSVKQDIYNTLFKQGKKVTLAKLVQYLQINGLIKPGENNAISGINNGFQHSLVSFGRFYSVLGERMDEYEMHKMAEAIIFQGTVFSNDRAMLKNWIERTYGEKSEKKYLTNEQIKRIIGFKWNDWGKLSKEFLYLKGHIKNYTDEISLIDAMWLTNNNLMELLSDNYDFKENLNKKVKKKECLLTEFNFEDLNDTYLSAPAKRMVWQSLLIIKELVAVIGEQPRKIFIKVPRTDGEKGRTTDCRKKRLEELYKQCKKDGQEWLKEISELSEDDFRSKKIYLYYRQKGRCMYTGNRISLEELLSNNFKYNIDHIYPKHYVKDESLENNLVLVEKGSNRHKSDIYPIEESVQRECKELWDELLTGGFISKEKYQRLTRKTPFTDEELASFIESQITEKGQATKFIANLLTQLLPGSEVVYTKNSNVADFRRKMDILRTFSINDHHYAHEAYLNAVVGNVYDVKFTKSPLRFIKDFRGSNTKYHMDKIFEYDVIKNDNIAWRVGENGSIHTIKKMVQKNSPLVSKRTFESHGGIADQTIYPAKKANNEYYIPIKMTDTRMQDVTKYGGFSSVAGAYYFLVEHDKKGKKVRTIESMPVYLKDKVEEDIWELEKYCINKLGYKNPTIRVSKIPMRALIKRNGFFMSIGGRTGTNIVAYNAVQLCLNMKWNNYVKSMENFKEHEKEIDNRKDKNKVTREKNLELFDEITEKHLSTIFVKKPNPLGPKLIDKKEKFEKLSLKEQVHVLLELLKATRTQNFLIQAKEIDVKSSYAAFSKEISGTEEFLLITQSITGIYQSVIDLKTV